MNREKVLEAIIEGYRNTVSQRYQYQFIKETYGLPETIDEETVNQLREYFLNYMYPTYDKRTELNQAFNSLDDYIKHPQKLLSLLLEAAKLIFKYGRHLPKILQAGLSAMKTFKAATNFEDNLVDEALKNKITAPYNFVKINALLKLLSREEIEKFIESSQSLFEILHDKMLIKKIKEVIEYLIAAMQKKPTLYSKNQIKGLEIGLEMISKGDAIFNGLSKKDQQNLVKLITDIERSNLDAIF
jgi:Lhr-like helicase